MCDKKRKSEEHIFKNPLFSRLIARRLKIDKKCERQKCRKFYQVSFSSTTKFHATHRFQDINKKTKNETENLTHF